MIPLSYNEDLQEAAMRLKRLSILIVEDEGQLNEAYQIILKKAGYNVRIALNGNEALEITNAFTPDLILLDLHMPHMDGISFLKKYDLTSKHPDVKVIIFSNYDLQEDVDEAYKLGAQRYILKAGASARELLQTVESTLHL